MRRGILLEGTLQANKKKARPPFGERTFLMAEWTGLEPATPGVTGRYSNQLNYHSIFWWVLTGSNRRPSPCKGDALPAELSTRKTTAGAAQAAATSSCRADKQRSYMTFLLGPLGRAAR